MCCGLVCCGVMVALDKGIPSSILEDMLMIRTCLGADMIAVSQDSGPIDVKEIGFSKSFISTNLDCPKYLLLY